MNDTAIAIFLVFVLFATVMGVSYEAGMKNQPMFIQSKGKFSDTTEYYIVHYGRNMRKKQVCDSYYTISDSTLLVYNGSDSMIIKQPYTVGVYEKTR